MDDLQQMSCIVACQTLVLRAAAAADGGDPVALANLFTADAVLERPNSAPIQGREAIRAAYAERPVDRLTRHLVTGTLVTPHGDTEASARSLVLLWSGSLKDPPGPAGRPAASRQVVGEFHDRLVRTPEGWRIAARQALFVLFYEVGVTP